MGSSINVYLRHAESTEVTKFLNSTASPVRTVTGEQWNYSNSRDPLVFIYFNEFALDSYEEVDELEELLYRSEDLSLLTLAIDLRLSQHGKASVKAAKCLVLKILSFFNGFVRDDEGMFWDYDDLKDNKKKDGLCFLQKELESCTK